MTQINQNTKLRLALVSAIAMIASGCATTPIPVTKQEVSTRVSTDRNQMYADQEPITGPMTFADVAARAVKYNLDYRLKMMDGALAMNMLSVSRWDMLPRLLVNAGYTNRSNDNAARSLTIEPNTIGPFHSTSQERSQRLAGAEFSWNVLDLGVSYYRSKQLADQALIAQERQRKVVQNIMQDVRVAYWRAMGAQKMSARLDDLLKRTERALDRARQIEKQNLQPLPQTLAYQMALLDATTLIQQRRQELELSKVELAALMNLAPGTQFTLADETQAVLPAAPQGFGELEEIALNQRPELIEEDYRKRISANDIRRQIVSALPGLSIDLGAQNNSNSYLLNNSWVDSGLRLSFNLLKLASIPSVLKAGETQRDVDRTRSMAQAMAILTQVRVASIRYGLAVSELKQVNETAEVASRLSDYAKSASAAKVDSALEQIRAEARAMLYEYQRYVAYSNAQAAWGRLYNSLGHDITPATDASLKEISATISKSMSQWQALTFKAAKTSEVELPTLKLVFQAGTAADTEAALNAGLNQALERHKIGLTPKDGRESRVLRVTWQEDKKPNSNKTGHLLLELLSPQGAVIGKSQFSSAILETMEKGNLVNFAQAAVDANIDAIVETLSTRAARTLALESSSVKETASN